MHGRNDQGGFAISQVLAQCALTVFLFSLGLIAVYVSIFIYGYYQTIGFPSENGKIFLDSGVLGLFAAPVFYLASLIAAVWGK